MNKNKILPILIVVLSLDFLALGLLMLQKYDCNCSVVEKKEEHVNVETEDAPKDLSSKSVVVEGIGQQNSFFLYGTVKKEPIPEEMELGDFWYWIYFDEPHLLTVSASGVPQYIEKLQVNPTEFEEMYNLEEFLNERVEIYGYLTSGYAESNVFQITAIRKY
jgi:hypothetical protein